jgi:hypothetical protein
MPDATSTHWSAFWRSSSTSSPPCADGTSQPLYFDGIVRIDVTEPVNHDTAEPAPGSHVTASM